MACSEEACMEKNVCRKYSHCERGVKLFGVRLTDGMIRKSLSTGNLAGYGVSNPIRCSVQENLESSEGRLGLDPQGYVSDGLVQNCGTLRERKKGVPWTEDEHRLFLVGLQKLGKGDWRGISRNFVPSRTPTQVASHAQKYFLRQSNLGKRRRRSSLFDIISTNTMASVDRPSHVAPPSMAVGELSQLVTRIRTGYHFSETVGVSAELCLGRPSELELQGHKPHGGEWKHGISDTNVIRPKATITSTDLWWAPPTSRASPIFKVHEAMEPSLSGLGLAIASPALSLEQPLELSLKLEQPATTANVPRHSAFHPSTMTGAMVPKNSSSSLNAIRVV